MTEQKMKIVHLTEAEQVLKGRILRSLDGKSFIRVETLSCHIVPDNGDDFLLIKGPALTLDDSLGGPSVVKSWTMTHITVKTPKPITDCCTEEILSHIAKTFPPMDSTLELKQRIEQANDYARSVVNALLAPEPQKDDGSPHPYGPVFGMDD